MFWSQTINSSCSEAVTLFGQPEKLCRSHQAKHSITSTDHLPLCLNLTSLDRLYHLITGDINSVLLKENAKFPQIPFRSGPDLVFPGSSKSNTPQSPLSVSPITLSQKPKYPMDSYWSEYPNRKLWHNTTCLMTCRIPHSKHFTTRQEPTMSHVAVKSS